MFNLVKWAYHLGRQTERARVASLIQNHHRYMRQPRSIAHEIFGKIEDPADAQTLEQITHGIDQGVKDIVDSISQPTNYDNKHYSLLFPKEKK